jgi:excinuclease UvrABC nuclease subunit
LYLSINQCSGPCTANITPDAYRRDILGAIALLKGEKVPILDQLEKDIVMYSDRFEYEKAASAKKKLLALEKLRLKSHKLFQLSHNIDAVLLLRAYHAAECTVFFIQEERVVNHTHINTTMDSDEMSSRVGQCLRAEPSILKEAWLTSCVKEVYADKKYFPFMQETSPEQNIRNVLTCVIEFMSAG